MPNKERFVDLLDKMKESNTFLTMKNGQSVYSAFEVDKLENCGYFDKTRRKMQEARKHNRTTGGCFRDCGLAECFTQQNWFINNADPNDAKIQIDESIYVENELDRDGFMVGEVTRSRMGQLTVKPIKEQQALCCKGLSTKCDKCMSQALYFECTS